MTHVLNTPPEQVMNFSYQARKNGQVAIYHNGRPARTLTGKDAARFLRNVTGADEETQQLWMARVTVNFERGNERPIDRTSR